MKTKSVLLPVLLALLACSHRSPTGSEADPAWAGPYSEDDWMSGDDRVAYVKRIERAPSQSKVTQYKTTGTCGGFPRIDLKTAPGFCVGLVYDGAATLKKARWAAPVGPNQVALTDMGGWGKHNGRIHLLSFKDGRSTLKKILSSENFSSADPKRGIIDRPNQISRGPDGRIYVGAAGGVFRFDPLASRPEKTVEAWIANIPSAGLHPLKSFAFDGRGNIYVNVGSASNVCQNFTRFGDSNPEKNPKNHRRQQFSSCPEAEDSAIGQGLIRRYRVLADGSASADFAVHARGLRNSIALTWDSRRQVLLQGENSRDAINKFAPQILNADFPHEEINVLAEGGHYGWPYCYDMNLTSPEWTNVDCAKYAKPHLLIPAHAAPLGFHVYEGSLFPAWYKGRLLASFHGYEAKGHRLVAFKRDDQGLPVGVPQSVIYDWNVRGAQGMGKPVGLAEMPDGSLLIVEDDPQNKILRLFYEPGKGDGKPVQEIDRAEASPGPGGSREEVLKNRLADKLRDGNAPPFTMFQHKVIDKTCYECHQAEGSPGVQLIRYDDDGNAKRIRETGKAREILDMIKGSPDYPAMPPQGWDSEAEQAEAVRLLEAWIRSI